MSADTFIIAIMVVSIVAIIGGSVNGIISKATAYYLEKDSRKRGSHSGGDLKVGQIADRTEMIEERLAVLERLATDRGTLLSDEIEALRLDVAERRETEKS